MEVREAAATRNAACQSKDNKPVCPALSMALCVQELPLAGHSCWPSNSHLKYRARKSSSQDCPVLSVPRSLVTGRPVVLGTLLWEGLLSPLVLGQSDRTNDPYCSSRPPSVLAATGQVVSFHR